MDRKRRHRELVPPEVLVVEDNAYEREILSAAVMSEEDHLQLHFASGASEAEALLFGEGGGSRPCIRVVLLDLHLTDSDGRDLLRKIRSHPGTAFLPVIVFSSSSEPRTVADCYRLGANSYVVKPSSFGEFCEVVRILVRYWTGMNEPFPEAEHNDG